MVVLVTVLLELDLKWDKISAASLSTGGRVPGVLSLVALLNSPGDLLG